MESDMSQQFTYHPGGGMKPHQPPAATNPWTNPQPSTPSTQQSTGWNPWTNPPATAPFSDTGHHYVYQPVFSGAAETPQQPTARSSWSNPAAPTASISFSSNWSHQVVCSPSFATTVRNHHQQTDSSLWRDPTSTPVPSSIPSFSALHLAQSRNVC